MSEAAAPIADDLFDGHAITEHMVKITKAGDGLSEALQANGLTIEAGKTYDVVLRVKAGGATFKPVKAGDEDGDYRRTDNLVAQYALVTDSSTIAKVLDKHEKVITEARIAAKEQAEGLKRIPFGDTDTDAEQAGEDGVELADVHKIGGDDWADEDAAGDADGGEPDAEA